MFDKMKQLMDMQKKMQELKKQLDNTNFEIKSSDGFVRIVMNGAQEVQEITIEADPKELEKTTLEKSLKDAYNKAIKRSQEVAASKMKELTGFNLPGLP